MTPLYKLVDVDPKNAGMLLGSSYVESYFSSSYKFHNRSISSLRTMPEAQQFVADIQRFMQTLRSSFASSMDEDMYGFDDPGAAVALREFRSSVSEPDSNIQTIERIIYRLSGSLVMTPGVDVWEQATLQRIGGALKHGLTLGKKAHPIVEGPHGEKQSQMDDPITEFYAMLDGLESL